MRKLCYLTWGLSFLLFLIIGCKDDEAKKSDAAAYDPNLPVKFTEFLPDSGGIRTKFIIKGSNFGNDKTKVKVFFKDSEGTERQSLILGLNSEVIYTQVPKQADGMSQIRVEVEEKSAELADTEKRFRYIVATSVSTVVGKAKEGAGFTNGTLGETTFTEPRYMMIDDEENIIVTDQNRLRLISMRNNKSITLYNNGASMEQPFVMDKAGKKMLWYNTPFPGNIFVFDASTGWVAEPYGKLFNASQWTSGCILDPIDSTHVVYRQNTGQLYVQRFTNNIKFEKSHLIGSVYPLGANSPMKYNKVDGYIYVSLQNPSAIYRYKLKTGPEGYPVFDGEPEVYIQNGAGYRDGHISEAQIRGPQGIDIDSDGNIYIADTQNHVIRKVNIKTGMVTTIAGKAGSAGYVDGDPLDARFNLPFGVFLDKEGTIYITDKANRCIRKLAIE